MTEWFGSTHYGLPSPIADMMADGFEEPSTNLTLEERMIRLKNDDSDLEFYKEGIDGYAYGSQILLQRMKSTGFFKKIDPKGMYKYPCTTNMNYGWLLKDPELLKSTWHRNAKTFNKPKTEITKFVEFALALDKFFKF